MYGLRAYVTSVSSPDILNSTMVSDPSLAMRWVYSNGPQRGPDGFEEMHRHGEGLRGALSDAMTASKPVRAPTPAVDSLSRIEEANR